MVPTVDKKNNSNSQSVKRYFKLEKLVCIDLVSENKLIKSIKITGDFFLHPEEKIDSIEAGLVGTKLEAGQVKQRLESFLAGCEYYGFDIDSLSDAIVQCMEGKHH